MASALVDKWRLSFDAELFAELPYDAAAAAEAPDGDAAGGNCNALCCWQQGPCGAGMAVAGAAGAPNLHQDTQSCPFSMAAGPPLLLAVQTAVDRPLEACSCTFPSLALEPALLQSFKWWRRRPRRRPPRRSPHACSRRARSGRSASRCDCIAGEAVLRSWRARPCHSCFSRLGQQLPIPLS